MLIQFKTEAGDIITTHVARICCIAKPPLSLGRSVGKHAVWIEGFTTPIAVKEMDFDTIETAFKDYHEAFKG